MIYAGVDVGSMSAEAVLMQDNEILASSVIVVKPNPVESATEAMSVVLQDAGVALEDIAYCVSTGYGREKIPFSDHDVSEISCHGKGAHWADASVRTIVYIGGQDCKVVRIDAEGDLADFIMNDKCAAGTGRFLEGIAKSFDVQVSDLGPMALRGSDPVPINSICTIFTQFDAMCLLADGRTKEDIALGVAEALALRVSKLACQVGVEDKVCMTGGVAKNPAVVKAMESAIGKEVVLLTVDPQIVGALGAAIYAAERYQKQEIVFDKAAQE